jgi:hypothetical protein
MRPPTSYVFSYSPLDQTRVFNASLLAAETLAGRRWGWPAKTAFVKTGLRAARYVIRRNAKTDRGLHGADGYQSWCDNFQHRLSSDQSVED